MFISLYLSYALIKIGILLCECLVGLAKIFVLVMMFYSLVENYF